MSIYYSLANDISGEKLVRDISQLVNKFIQDGGDNKNSVLVIEIHTVTDHSGDSPIPKIELKDCST